MRNDSKILAVQFAEHLLQIGKDVGVPNKGTVLSVPARGAKSSAQVDQGIAGQSLFPKDFRFVENLLPIRERAVRLLIPETPQRRHLRLTSDARILCHDCDRVARCHEEHIDGKCGPGLGYKKPPFGSGQIKGSVRLVKEYCPARCSDEPWNGHSATVSGELIDILPVAHQVGRAAPIVLGSTFSQAKDRRVADEK